MKFSEMKLQATNAVRAYFIRNWTREDLMNSGEIPENAHTSLKKRTRVSLLMCAACNLGASFDLFTKYLFEMNQYLVVSLLVGPTAAIGAVWLEALFSRERSDVYLGCLTYSWALMFSTFVASTSDLIDSYAAHWMLKVCIVFALFMGYLVVYSQEIVYDAHFGEINFVNRTLTIFFHLPGIVVHAARLCLGAEIEQHRQN
ncbi:bax inhibitor 1-like isoform X2 [Solanum dulcamara]|uniref:bax inhibitor 1-like isoform X2 n=1 Tax=Solanum dulcamara TaxID=45834 RepID=UPI002485D59E|nr:bax inhibitor 1-like isoform X2 [Solanum dulcamara]